MKSSKLDFFRTMPQGGPYFARIRGKRKPAYYRLKTTAKPQQDAGLPIDAGDDLPKALGVDAGAVIAGQIGGYDKKDWYRLHVPGGDILRMRFHVEPGANPRLSARLLDRYNNTTWKSYDMGRTGKQSVEIPTSRTSEPHFFLEVGTSTFDTIEYRFEYSCETQNDGLSHKDAADRKSDADNIEPMHSVSGVLGGFDMRDWYVFKPAKGQILEFSTAETGNFELNIHIFEPSGNWAWHRTRVKPMQKKYFTIKRIVKPQHMPEAEVEYAIRVSCKENRNAQCPNEAMPYRIDLSKSQ